jgi:cell division protein FtsQ
MARKGGSTIMQEELYPPSAHAAREELDDARLVDLDVDEESPFLRGQKRVSARRSALPKKTANGLMWASIAAAVLCVLGLGAAWLYHYGEHSWRFRVESSDNIEVTGMQNVTKAQIMEVMGADIGRNIFFIPLDQQQTQLEQIPWVESASVMRFVPNRLKVQIQERTPVAFARVGPKIALIDARGTLMDLSPKHKYSFPVILGMNPGEPLSTRAPRMKVYSELVRDLDAGGAHHSQDLSEVDLSDLDDLRVRVNDPAGDVLVHLGSSDYLKRYTTYVTHAQEWRQQFQKLESVNLRYDNQVIVNPDLEGTPKAVGMSAAAIKAAKAAGVKQASLITRVGRHDRPVPKLAFALQEKKLTPKTTTASVKKPVAKPPAKNLTAKQKKAAAPGKRVVAKKTASSKVGKPAAKSATAWSATHHSAPKPTAGTPVQHMARASGPPATSVPKPSAAIAKQPANQNSN